MAHVRSEKHLLARQTGIIIAADVVELGELRSLVSAAADIPEVVAIKIGFTLGLTHGLVKVVRAIRELSNLPVIYDHQKAGTDIPEMGKTFANVCQDAQVDGVIFFPLAGPRSMEGFVSGAIGAGLSPIVGLTMTHAAYLQSEGGFMTDTAPETICKMAIDFGVEHFVLPGTKPTIVERFAKGPLLKLSAASIMMPGIGSQGGTLSTAFKAAAPHRRFAIVGSAIYRAANPKEALSAFAAEVRRE